MTIRTETLISFFSGTGYDFDEEAIGYVTPKELKVKEPVDLPPHYDQSFSHLNACLDDSQPRLGYDGCHQRGGGLFAYGAEEPAGHLYQKVKTRLASGEIDKIKLVITAHSRGGCGALQAVKLIGNDPKIKDKVDIVLDFRDPVPGNFSFTSKFDVTKIFSIAAQLRNFKNCKSIKEVNITVQEKGIIDVAFDVLIPEFAKNVKVSIDCLPGLHDIQERIDINMHRNFYYKGTYARNTNAYLHGLCKSFYFYSKADAKIDYAKFVCLLKLYSDKTTDNVLDKYIRHKFKARKVIEKDGQPAYRINPTPSKEEFEDLLEKCQIGFYENILNEYKEHPDRKLHARHLHFGGKYHANTTAKEATHLNERHFDLDQRINARSHDNINLLLDFKGERLDLGKRQKLTGVITELRKACEGQIVHELKKGKNDKAEELKNLLVTIKDNPFTWQEKLKQCQAFIVDFQKGSYSNPNEKYRKHFRRNVLHILASLLTLGIYAGVRAYYSYKTRGYYQFWQTRKEAFMNNVGKRIGASELTVDKDEQPSSLRGVLLAHDLHK